MDHEKIPIPQLDTSDLQRYSVPVVTEEEDRISSVVKPLVRQAAALDDVGRPLTADPMPEGWRRESERHDRIPYIVSYTIGKVKAGSHV